MGASEENDKAASAGEEPSPFGARRRDVASRVFSSHGREFEKRIKCHSLKVVQRGLKLNVPMHSRLATSELT
ncbi:hypothetical protein B5X24_HaOG209631 [Helicoverpa armigera]|nr:hypothetical protein B5X24_HaOG209631 [Helicoverpa armigera]